MDDEERLPQKVQRLEHPELWMNEEAALADFKCSPERLYEAVKSQAVRVVYTPLTRPFDGSTEPVLYIPDLERAFVRRSSVAGDLGEGAKAIGIAALGGAGGTILAGAATDTGGSPDENTVQASPGRRPFVRQWSTDTKVFRVTIEAGASIANFRFDTYATQFTRPPKHASLMMPDLTSIKLKSEIVSIKPLDNRWSFYGTIQCRPQDLYGRYLVRASYPLGELIDTFNLNDE